MNQPAKIFIVGALCAALIAAAGLLNNYFLASKLHTLESECVHEGNKEEGQQNKLDFSRYGTLICDAKELSSLGELKGIQAQIVQAQNDVWASKKWPYSIAVLVLFFSVVPWIWYFLLRRIREVRDAIVGK